MDEAQRILVADIGGTHTRLALAVSRAGRLQLDSIECMPTGVDLPALLARYLDSVGGPRVAGLGICAAGPLDQGPDGPQIRLTNQPILVRIAELGRHVGAAQAVLLNDFTAVAQAIPVLDAGELRPIGNGVPRRPAAMAVIGAGTGLGVSGLLPAAGGYSVIEGEGGHRDLHGGTPEERAVLEHACEGEHRLSAEDILSGPGLERLYRGVQRAEGRAVQARTASEIAQLAFEGQDALALRCIDLFTVLLGRVAGDLALTLGARGGVYLAGGIVAAWGERFNARRFRQGFEDKHRMEAYLAAIPTYVITHPQPGLLGMAAAVHARIRA